MNLLYIGIPAIGTLIAGHLLITTWRRLSIDRRLTTFWLLGLAAFIWAIGYLGEMLAPTLAGKLIWAQAQYLGIAWVPPLWFFFISSYKHPVRWLNRRIIGLLAIVPTLTMLLAWSNPTHHLIWADYRLVAPLDFPVLEVAYGPAFWVHVAHSYGLVLLGFVMLLRNIQRSSDHKNKRNVLLIMAGGMPWLGNLLYITRINESLLDFTLLGFVLSGLFFFLAIFRYQFLDILPIAHQLVLKSLPDPVLFFDTENRLVNLNPAAQQAFNGLTEHPIGQRLESIFAEYPTVIEKLQVASRADDYLTTIYLYNKAHYHIRAEPLYTKQQEKIGQVLVLRDISDHIYYQSAIKNHNNQLKNLNRQLEEALQQAEIANKAKEQFLATTTHDLRTPITNMILYLSLMEKRPENSDDYLSTIKHEATRMKAQVEDLLNLARLEQTTTEFNTTPLDLNTLVMEYVTDRQAALDRRQLTLNVTLDPSLPMIEGNQMLLGRVIGNLLGNAVSYTPAGGRILIQTIRQIDEAMPGIMMNVCDTGQGIPTEERAKIFEHFYRGSNQAGNTEGTGLGLAISREIVERHNGWIRVEDGVDDYRTQFSVWLPLVDDPVMMAAELQAS